MSKTFDEVVQNNTKPSSEWQVEINGVDYTRNVSLIEFENEVNNPLSLSVEVNGVSGRNTDIVQGREIAVKYSDFTLFRGVLQEVDSGTGLENSLSASGYAGELDGDISNHYQGTNVTTVVNDLVDGTSTATGKTINTNVSLDTTPLAVEDFRVNKTQLEDVNRLMGEYGLEWYESFDGSNEPVFNVVNQILNDDGSGNTIDTIITHGPNQNAQRVNRNTNRNEGDYDGVVVRGYGDGDDQITATAGTTGKGNKVLIYTDKTILSSSQAQKRADRLAAERTVYWREIRVKPSTPNQLFGLGDFLTVDAEDARLDDDYRVVGTYYKIDLVDEEIDVEIQLSNKPQTFLSEFKTEESKREGETDHSQGMRNTINEANKDLADTGSATKVEFNIPERFTRDITGQDTTAQVRLDYVVDDYQKAFQASDVTTIDDSTRLMVEQVNDFGDVEVTYTRDDSQATADYTQVPTDGHSEVIGGGNTESVQYTADEGVYVTADTVYTGSTSIEGVYIHAQVKQESENRIQRYGETGDIDGDGSTDSVVLYNQGDGGLLDQVLTAGETSEGVANTALIQFAANIVGGGAFPNDGASSVEPIVKTPAMGVNGAAQADFGLFIPGNKTEEAIELQFLHSSLAGDPTGENWNVTYTYYTVEKTRVPSEPDGADNVNAYTEAEGGGNIDASQNAAQNRVNAPNDQTTTFGKLDSNDIVLQDQATNATQLTVRVNGTEISSSPFSLSSGPPYKNQDIQIPLAQLNTPGQNTIELEPDSKALVKGNVVVDHKLESERGV